MPELSKMTWVELEKLSNEPGIKKAVRQNMKDDEADLFQELRIRRFLQETRQKYQKLLKIVKDDLKKNNITPSDDDFSRWVYFSIVNEPSTYLHQVWLRISQKDREGFNKLNPYPENKVCRLK